MYFNQKQPTITSYGAQITPLQGVLARIAQQVGPQIKQSAQPKEAAQFEDILGSAPGSLANTQINAVVPSLANGYMALTPWAGPNDISRR